MPCQTKKLLRPLGEVKKRQKDRYFEGYSCALQRIVVWLLC